MVPPTAAQRAPSETGRAQPAAQHTPQSGQKTEAAASNDIVERVMPTVFPSALRTIQGTIKVRVRVNADRDGNVTEAALTDAGSSKYFARVALEAARRWKFAQAYDESARHWTLLFAFKRSGTEASASRAR